MPRTRIVCTIRPSSSREDVLRALIDAGMNMARLNFSQGTYDDHAAGTTNMLGVRRL